MGRLEGLGEASVVRDRHDTAVVFSERLAEGVDGLKIEVVAGLVEEEAGGGLQGEAGEGHAGLLTPAQAADGGVRGGGSREAHSPEHAPGGLVRQAGVHRPGLAENEVQAGPVAREVLRQVLREDAYFEPRTHVAAPRR